MLVSNEMDVEGKASAGVHSVLCSQEKNDNWAAAGHAAIGVGMQRAQTSGCASSSAEASAAAGVLATAALLPNTAGPKLRPMAAGPPETWSGQNTAWWSYGSHKSKGKNENDTWRQGREGVGRRRLENGVEIYDGDSGEADGLGCNDDGRGSGGSGSSGWLLHRDFSCSKFFSNSSLFLFFVLEPGINFIK
jgi:hypothetical protein